MMTINEIELNNQSPSLLNEVDDEELWVKAVVNDNCEIARDILCKGLTSTVNISLRNIFCKKDHILKHIQAQCVLSDSPYIPDNAWCLAATFDAREVLQVMRDFGATATQKNSHGNTLLHCIIAHASLLSEGGEMQAISGINFIKSLLSEDEFNEILLTENEHSLRPLELAVHLGTFILFRNLFEGSSLYLAKTEDFDFYTIQYYDITEYVNGKRRDRSPLLLLHNLDKNKLHHKSTRYMFLEDPMASWYAAVKYSNMPVLLIWSLLRIILIASFFASVVIAKFDLKLYNFQEADYIIRANETISGAGNDETSNSRTVLLIFLYYNILFSGFALTLNLVIVIFRWIIFRKYKWINKTVSGNKNAAAYSCFYSLCQITMFIVVFVMSQDMIQALMDIKQKMFSAECIRSMILIAVCACVWDVLYFLQLVSGLSIYAIAVQQMLLDFLSFSVILMLFFISYAFGFYILTDNATHFITSLYDTFRIMLNMVDFSQASSGLQLLHVIFIFMILYLLLNILIAIFTSSFEEVKRCKDIILRLQAMPLTLSFDNLLSVKMESFYNLRRKKYFVFEDGKIYVTKVVMWPVHVHAEHHANTINGLNTYPGLH